MLQQQRPSRPLGLGQPSPVAHTKPKTHRRHQSGVIAISTPMPLGPATLGPTHSRLPRHTYLACIGCDWRRAWLACFGSSGPPAPSRNGFQGACWMECVLARPGSPLALLLRNTYVRRGMELTCQKKQPRCRRRQGICRRSAQPAKSVAASSEKHTPSSARTKEPELYVLERVDPGSGSSQRRRHPTRIPGIFDRVPC